MTRRDCAADQITFQMQHTFSVNKTENDNHYDFGDLEQKAGKLLRVCGGKSPV